MTGRQRVAITGASGFIGGNAARHLSAMGHEVVSLGRSRVDGVMEHRRYELGLQPEPGCFADVDVLIHCAYDFSVTTPSAIYQRNVVGTANLLRAAAHADVRVIFISSMSAYDGTRQLYGRAKLEGERFVDELGGVSLRLGLVWGGTDPGGMAGAVQRLTALPVVPVMGRRSHQFAVHQDNVNQAIAAVVGDREIRGLLSVAHPTPIPAPALLAGLAREGGGKQLRLLPIPWRPVYWAMRACEASHLSLPLRADSVLGLVRPADQPVGASRWGELGVTLRSFPLAS